MTTKIQILRSTEHEFSLGIFFICRVMRKRLKAHLMVIFLGSFAVQRSEHLILQVSQGSLRMYNQFC